MKGPFYLFTGRFSNDQSTRGRGESEAFGGPAQGGEKIESFADAHAKAMSHMAGGNQASFRIEDKNGAIIESDGPFGGKQLSAARIANPSAPKADNSALADAEKVLAGRQSSSNQAIQKYESDKAAYDRDLAAYNAAVGRADPAIQAAIRDAGSPTPTAAQASAPAGDYQVQNFDEINTKYKGKPLGDGTAASFVQQVAKLPDPADWGKGVAVKGANLRPGTPIATLKADGFTAGPGNHAAIYITQNGKGVWVYDQYKTASGEQRPVEARFIRFKNGAGSLSNDGSAYL